MQLEINGIEVDCVIGDRPDERSRRQRLSVDVKMTVADTAAQTDALSDTVDYVQIAENIRKRLVAAECRMVERAAALALAAVRSFAGVKAAEVAVTKFSAVPGIASATARIGFGAASGELAG